MNLDKEKNPAKRQFWSNLFRPRGSKKTAKLEKERPWRLDEEPIIPPSPPIPANPYRQSAPLQPQRGPPAGGQSYVRPQNAVPVQQHQSQHQSQHQHQHSLPALAGDGADKIHRSRSAPLPPALPVTDARAKGKRTRSSATAAPEDRNGRQVVIPQGPLTEWPPRGVPATAELSLPSALELITRGAPVHTGHRREVPHTPVDYYTLCTTTSNKQPAGSVHGSSGRRSLDRNSRERSRSRRGDRTTNPDASLDDVTDAAIVQDSMMELMTMRVTQSGRSRPPASYPWETLEQPSYTFCYGRHPGTITLSHWVSQSDHLPQPIALRDSGVRPREADLVQVCKRFRQLQRDGLAEGDADQLYRSLYKYILRDPDHHTNPHRTLDKQITDLIMALSRPDYWADLSNPRNQIVTRYLFDRGLASHHHYVRFLHQLLLSLELEMRISSRQHDEWAKEKLILQLPPTLQYNLALARRWRENVRVEAYGQTADQVKLRFKLKSRQIRMLRRFAHAMKWPNLAATVSNLKQRDADGSLESISSHVLAFFSGLVLPGPTLPFIIMNALIDIDPDRATDDLAQLTHLHPHCGFQYRNSYTYWTSTSIVGKVLAPTCRELAGWVGPARPTADLGRSQIARIRSRRPRQRIAVDDVESMRERSDPLGPTAEVFPVAEYKLVSTDITDVIDTVRMELLTLRPAPHYGAHSAPNYSSAGPENGEEGGGSGGASANPRLYDASIQFAIDGVSWPLRLNFDISFVCAWPCTNGPHPLFFDYSFATVKADMVVHVNDWATVYPAANGHSSTPTVRFGGTTVLGTQLPPVSKEGDDERVLVIEAFGVPDNEVLARAWCAHWGLSAVVADANKTCMACAIREAYAATITVVILVDGQAVTNDE